MAQFDLAGLVYFLTAPKNKWWAACKTRIQVFGLCGDRYVQHISDTNNFSSCGRLWFVKFENKRMFKFQSACGQMKSAGNGRSSKKRGNNGNGKLFRMSIQIVFLKNYT